MLPESQREQGRQSKKLFQYDFHNSEALATVSNPDEEQKATDLRIWASFVQWRRWVTVFLAHTALQCNPICPECSKETQQAGQLLLLQEQVNKIPVFCFVDTEPASRQLLQQAVQERNTTNVYWKHKKNKHVISVTAWIQFLGEAVKEALDILHLQMILHINAVNHNTWHMTWCYVFAQLFS